MNGRLVLATDQGATNTKAVLVNDAGIVVARVQSPLTTAYPNPGWAEQSAEDIWAPVQTVIAQIAATVDQPIDAVGIANQRETLVARDARTSRPICPAILWKCRRTAGPCADLIAAGHDPVVVAATGPSINPLFPASKLVSVLQNVAGARDLAE